MTAVLLKAIRDLRRRRLPAIVIFGTTLLAVVTATMTLTLMSQARDPYQAAFDAQKGAHLQVEGELRSREYADKKNNDVQLRVWEVRADSILKLDRAEQAPPEDQLDAGPAEDEGPF